MTDYPLSLQSESLMRHMQVLCKDIGPRPPTSEQERRAAAYVETALRRMGVTDIQRQPFKSQDSLGWEMLPSLIAGLVATALGGLGGRWGKALGGGLLLGSAWSVRQSFRVKPQFYHKLIARGASQNVIARIPAAGQAQRTVYLVGHLDSQKQRFQFPTSSPELMQPQTSLPIALGALSGLLLLAEALRKRPSRSRWLWAVAAAYVWGVGGAIYDEMQPHVEGANDNATAVSVLLGMAQALRAQPLEHTDVVVLFTGCEEPGCVGMAHYLQDYAPARDTTLWLDVDIVGAGNVCYVTQHGITPFARYAPHPEMVDLAARVAQQHPELAVTGKAMTVIDEVANLRQAGYKALLVSSYDEKGTLPNWHRLSDTLSNIEPETLSRAARYVWELIQEVNRDAA